MRLARKLLKSLTTIPDQPNNQPTSSTSHINTQTQFIQHFQQVFSNSVNLQPCLVDPDHLHQIVQTLKGLIVVIRELAREYAEMQEQHKLEEQMKKKVENHHAIVANLEQMYEGRINEIVERNKDGLRRMEHELEKEREVGKMLREQCEAKGRTIEALNSQVASLLKQLGELQEESQRLKKEIQRQQKHISSYQKTLQGTPYSTLPSTLSPTLQPLQLFLQSPITPLLTSFLDLHTLLQLRLVNHRSNFILTRDYRLLNEINKRVLQKSTANNEKTLKDIREYQGLVEAVTESNLRLWAIKYLYFKVKPGEYMGEVLAEMEEAKLGVKVKTGQPVQTERRRSILGVIFGEEKREEKSNRLNLRELADQEYIKKVETRLEEYFQGSIQIKNTDCLSNFRQLMTQQLKQLKQQLKNSNPIATLYSYSKFLYLQAQDLHRLSQSLFSLLLKSTRQTRQLQNQSQDLKQNYASTRRVLQQLSQERHRVQQANWKMEVEYLKFRNQNLRLEERLGRVEGELLQVRQESQLAMQQEKVLRGQLEELGRRNRNYEKQFETIHSLIVQEQIS